MSACIFHTHKPTPTHIQTRITLSSDFYTGLIWSLSIWCLMLATQVYPFILLQVAMFTYFMLFLYYAASKMPGTYFAQPINSL